MMKHRRELEKLVIIASEYFIMYFPQQKQIDRRRLMTESERREDDRRLDAAQPAGPVKGKYSFLQKYYHKVQHQRSLMFVERVLNDASGCFLPRFGKNWK